MNGGNESVRYIAGTQVTKGIYWSKGEEKDVDRKDPEHHQARDDVSSLISESISMNDQVDRMTSGAQFVFSAAGCGG